VSYGGAVGIMEDHHEGSSEHIPLPLDWGHRLDIFHGWYTTPLLKMASAAIVIRLIRFAHLYLQWIRRTTVAWAGLTLAMHGLDDGHAWEIKGYVPYLRTHRFERRVGK
jgi:hypothetical protein